MLRGDHRARGIGVGAGVGAGLGGGQAEHPVPRGGGGTCGERPAWAGGGTRLGGAVHTRRGGAAGLAARVCSGQRQVCVTRRAVCAHTAVARGSVRVRWAGIWGSPVPEPGARRRW